MNPLKLEKKPDEFFSQWAHPIIIISQTPLEWWNLVEEDFWKKTKKKVSRLSRKFYQLSCQSNCSTLYTFLFSQYYI